MFLLSVGWIRTNCYLCQLQSFQTSNLSVYTFYYYYFRCRYLVWFVLNRDSTIVSIADTGTSILAGVTIFSILGNLAFEKGQLDDIGSVVASGPGLAFVSYPEAISKFDAVPQVIYILKII